MRSFITFLLGIAAIIVLIFGSFHWNQRIEAAVKSDSSADVKPNSATTSETGNIETNEPNLLVYTHNWPASAVDRFKQRLKEKKPFKILFVGSPAIGSDTTGTFPIVKTKLLDTFGAGKVQVNLKTFKTTSTQFVNANQQAEIAAQKPDLMIFEPFILLNNGKVLIDDTLKDITKIMEDVQAVNPGTTFMLQPSYPIYEAKFYPVQVASLKQYAAGHKITYLDHWSAWPDTNSAALKEYVTPDQSAPSEKGIKAWSDFLINYLISK